jgi:hypothetical protein
MRSVVLILACFSVLFFSGCRSPHETMARDAIAILKEIADELSTIKDDSTAEAAAPRLKELGGRWRANERRMSGTRGPSVRDLKELEKKYGGQLQEAVNRYQIEVARVQRLPGGPEALAELGELKGRPGSGTK